MLIRVICCDSNRLTQLAVLAVRDSVPIKTCLLAAKAFRLNFG